MCLILVIKQSQSAPASTDLKFSPEALYPKRSKQGFDTGSLELDATFFMNDIFSFAHKKTDSKKQRTYIEDFIFSGMDQVVTAATRESYDPKSRQCYSICSRKLPGITCSAGNGLRSVR